MSGSNANTTTSSSSTEIPAWLQGHMQEIAGGAGDLYDRGIGPQSYPDQTWTDFNPVQHAGMDWTASTATTEGLNPRAYETAADIMDYGGVSQGAWESMGPMEDIASGYNGINTGNQYQGVLNSISGGNPYFQQLLDDQTRRTADQVNSQFSGSGRYGSGGHTGVLADRVAQQRNAAMAGQYNQDINNQYQGLLGLSNVQSTNIGNQFGASKGLMDFYQGAQDDAFKAALASPTFDESRYNDIGHLMGLGSMFEGKENQQLSDSMERFDFSNRQPWNQLGMYAQLLQGFNPGTKTNTTTQGPQPSMLQTGLGGAGIGAGIGSLVPGIGPLIGGVGGGLLGLAGRFL